MSSHCSGVSSVWYGFFFFQAEDGIRDKLVTGVQTCALPIWPASARLSTRRDEAGPAGRPGADPTPRPGAGRREDGRTAGLRPTHSLELEDHRRSEERRVGKECRARWSRDDEKKKDEMREKVV